jgi:uncharacterized integral membrane protein
MFAVNSPSEIKYPSWNVKFPAVYVILMGAVKRIITKLCKNKLIYSVKRFIRTILKHVYRKESIYVEK